MEIETLKTSSLRNEEHFQFHSVFKQMVEESGPGALGIESDFTIYVPLVSNADEALKTIHASAHTKALADADQLRDDTYRGIVGKVKTDCGHFRPEVKQAAERLLLVINNFGNVTNLPYEQESSTIAHLAADLTTVGAADMEQTGLGEWVNELIANNTAFDTLMKTRIDEGAGKSMVNLKTTRSAMDELYRRMVKRINALMIVNGEEAYAGFVTRLNIRIKQFEDLLAIRKGRGGKEDKGEGEKK